MTDVTHNSRIQRTIIRLLNHYSFDSEKRPMPFVVADWMGCYPLQWIVAAIVEALYQGRYKTISVEQILIIWQRRGRPLHHFNGEFERIVCGQLVGVASAAHKEESFDKLATDLSVVTQANLATNRIPKTVESYELEQPSTQHPASVDEHDHDANSLDYAYMGSDRRLSEMLGDESTQDEFSRPSKSHLALDVAKQAISLKQRDAESHKIPVAVFEPVDKTARTSEWQQLTGAPIRHHPIHQFTPIKASSTMHNKLKAIAHSHH